MSLADVNFLAVGIATVLAFALGALWYSPVTVRKAAVDFFQLADTVLAEVLHRGVLARFGRVRAELAVELFPREAQRPLERKRPVDEPEVQIETERRPFERPEGVQVERDRCAMISLNNSSPSRIVLSHNTGAAGRFTSHQNSARSAINDCTWTLWPVSA